MSAGTLSAISARLSLKTRQVSKPSDSGWKLADEEIQNKKDGLEVQWDHPVGFWLFVESDVWNLWVFFQILHQPLFISACKSTQED